MSQKERNEIEMIICQATLAIDAVIYAELYN
jgi:hypothetical protein